MIFIEIGQKQAKKSISVAIRMKMETTNYALYQVLFNELSHFVSAEN